MKTGQKYKDERSLRLGWAHLKVAREENRGELERRGEQGMKLPDNCPHALTPWQQMLSEPPGTIRCCRANDRALMLAEEEPLCRTMGERGRGLSLHLAQQLRWGRGGSHRAPGRCDHAPLAL